MPRSYRHERELRERSNEARTKRTPLAPSPASRRPRSLTPTTDLTGVIRCMQNNAMSRRNVPSMPILPPWSDDDEETR
jgi:hypothetical protein